MELQTISQVSKRYGISSRMLRYYEQAGLISSIRNEGNAYRFYDETALKQLDFIILLRKLRISVKQISDILKNQNALTALQIFERNISELDEEITSLSAIKSILTRFAEELRAKADMVLQLDLLNDTAAFSIIDSLSFSKNYINSIKENFTMEDLNKANEALSKLKDSDVRIIYLPPATVASAYAISDKPHDDSFTILEKFITDVDLFKIKPDMKVYGMGNNVTGNWVYEVWATIPDDFDVPAPLTKKTMGGGLYAAYTSTNFDERLLLKDWIDKNDKYEFDERENPGYSLEEAVNPFNIYGLKDTSMSGAGELVFLWSIKERSIL